MNRQSKPFVVSRTFTTGIEGPACDRNGNLYAVNYGEDGTIGKVSPEGICEMFIKLPEGSIGNGIRFDSHGDMLIADYKGHNLFKVKMATKELSVLAHSNLMNQPNDIAITATDIVFASDPNWIELTGNIWRIMPDGELTLMEKNMGTVNGIEVSPDEEYLFVNESRQRNIWRYRLSENGDLGHKELFYKFDDFEMDGMRCDEKGNLYVTRYHKGTIAIISPEAKLMEEISLIGKKCSNICFGGKDGRTCYITIADDGSIETFRADTRGRSFKLFYYK